MDLDLFNINKKTKIIATVGPVTTDYTKIKELIKNGVNLFRLNFSHGDHNEHFERIKIIQKINSEYNINIPIILDTKGPEIRIGKVKNDKITFKKGDIFNICFKDILGTEKKISISCNNFFDAIQEKEIIKMDDGNFNLTVLKKDKKNKELTVKANNDYVLKSLKNVNMPKKQIKMNFVSERDKKDLIFACKNNISYIAASFTSRAEDVKEMRKILNANNGKNIQIIAKIENVEAIEKIDEIIQEADGIMVARGDLGLNTPLAEVPIHQKKIIEKCRKAGKPVVVATQMLNSMQTNPQPTRAEVTDVFMAVTDSADMVMLSGETTSGAFPCEAVKTQCNVSIVAEKHLNYNDLLFSSLKDEKENKINAIASSVSSAALMLKAKAIFVFTKDEELIRKISKNRPLCPIICIVNDKNIALRNSFCWGVYSIFKKYNYNDIENIKTVKKISLDVAKELKINKKEPIVLCSLLDEKSKENFVHITYTE